MNWHSGRGLATVVFRQLFIQILRGLKGKQLSNRGKPCKHLWSHELHSWRGLAPAGLGRSFYPAFMGSKESRAAQQFISKNQKVKRDTEADSKVNFKIQTNHDNYIEVFCHNYHFLGCCCSLLCRLQNNTTVLFGQIHKNHIICVDMNWHSGGGLATVVFRQLFIQILTGLKGKHLSNRGKPCR